MSDQKLFIVGVARTGTSLLRDILNRSTEICVAPETHYLHRLAPFGKRQQLSNPYLPLSDDRNLTRFVNYLYTHPKISTYWEWAKRSIEPAEMILRLQQTDRSDQSIFATLLQLYAEKSGKGGATVILGEKTPAHLLYVPTLLEWFPQAKVLHTFRDPRAITVSRLKKVRQRSVGLRGKLPTTPDWLMNMVDPPVEIVRMSRSWLQAAELHFCYLAQFPNQYHMLRFEDLVQQPEAELRRVFNFLELPFDSKVLEDVVVVGSSYETQQRGPQGFDSQAIDRWRNYLGPLSRVWFSMVTRRQLKIFGYPR